LLARHQAWLSVGDHSFASFFMTLHMNFLLAPFCCLLLFALATSGGTTLSWLLSTRIAVLLGEISYSTYLGHFFAIYLVLQTPLSEVRHVSTIAKLAAAYLLSLVLYRCVEVPAKLALRRIFARLPTGAPPRPVRVGDA
jgi:peptidoglycan/LPS O-acetylase OafA/YrhL